MSSNNDATTKPTIETVLERINELGAKLGKQINDVAVELRAEILSLRAETEENFSTLNKKIDILNRELFEVKTEQGKHADRIDALERKPS